jgi:hypothetical protein
VALVRDSAGRGDFLLVDILVAEITGALVTVVAIALLRSSLSRFTERFDLRSLIQVEFQTAQFDCLLDPIRVFYDSIGFSKAESVNGTKLKRDGLCEYDSG